MKPAISTPAVMREITIESKNIACVELICHVDEAGVGEICGGVAVFVEDFLDVTCAGGKLKGNLKCSIGNICQDIFRGTADPSQQTATFSDDGFAGHQGRPEARTDRSALAMPSIALIEPSHEDAAVKQNRRHLSGLFPFLPGRL
ncbi:MAG: hypothetical protein WB679_04110 [Terracidiphilus sp.]